MIEWIASNLPSFLRLLVPFIPLLAAIVNKIPTRKTDPVEEKLRRLNAVFSGKTIQEIADLGRCLNSLKDS